MQDWLHRIIGADADTIVWWQMSIRALLIFFFTLALIRVGGKRIFGKNTTLDIVLGVILGSILSRALTANAQFIPTLTASATLVAVHALLARLSFRFPGLGHAVKGEEDKLVDGGELQWSNMRKNGVTRHELREAARIQASIRDLSSVEQAYLERSGEISIIKKG